MESEFLALVARYDNDMGERQDEIEMLQDEDSGVQKELAELRVSAIFT